MNVIETAKIIAARTSPLERACWEVDAAIPQKHHNPDARVNCERSNVA
ncbi:MAG TPA: hypothetical protein VEH52_04560 [Gaiellaceae bacterium]|nr:hypothetical protein [Gaiellaceae bacterium]